MYECNLISQQVKMIFVVLKLVCPLDILPYFRRMKTLLSFSVLAAVFLSACSASQDIVATYVDRANLPKEPYKKVFVMALLQDNIVRGQIENKITAQLVKRGKTVVKSSELFPVKLSKTEVSNEQLIQVIKDQGCDLVFTVALLDVKTTPNEENYIVTNNYCT